MSSENALSGKPLVKIENALKAAYEEYGGEGQTDRGGDLNCDEDRAEIGPPVSQGGSGFEGADYVAARDGIGGNESNKRYYEYGQAACENKAVEVKREAFGSGNVVRLKNSYEMNSPVCGKVASHSGDYREERNFAENR